jgi:hypothetical protein
MNNYIHSSYQHDEQLYSSSSRLPSVSEANDEDEELALALDLVHYYDNDINNINTGSNITGRCCFIRFPILIGIIMWVVCMTAEFSPIIMIASRFDNDNNSNDYHQDGKRNGVYSNKNENDDDYDNYDIVRETQKNAKHEMMGFSSSSSSSSSSSKSSTNTNINSNSNSNYVIHSCTIEECTSSPCGGGEDAAPAAAETTATPFDCLALRYNANVRGGCGGTPWTNDICAVQCDATNCIELLKEASSTSSSSSSSTSTASTATDTITITEDCDVDCPLEWCEKKMLCGGGASVNNASYQCTGGSSIYGCSPDKYQWTVRSSISDCSSCCKTTTC